MTKPDLPEGLALQLSRPEAVRSLGDVITRGQGLLRRTADPSAQTPAGQALDHDLRAWGADSVAVMAACFGPPAADVLRALPMRYKALDIAKKAMRRRLALLQEARDLAGRLRKTPGKTGDKSPARPKSKPKEKTEVKQIRSPRRPYHFCLSFAGEDRKYAEELHALLTARGMTAFYDEAEQHKLWGRNLYEYLADVYEHQAHFCVMFTSRSYVRKAWTGHEREFAQARAFKQPDYILPVRVDNTRVPGVAPTKGYLDVRKNSMADIADKAQRLLAERRPGSVEAPPAAPPGSR